MRAATSSVLLAMLIGCGGSMAAPATQNPPGQNPPSTTVTPDPWPLVCNKVITRMIEVPGTSVQMISSAFTVIRFGGTAVAGADASALGPGCLDTAGLQTLLACQGSLGCGRGIRPDELTSLHKQASTTWRTWNLGGQWSEATQLGTGAMLALDGDADVPRAMRSLFPTSNGPPPGPTGGAVVPTAGAVPAATSPLPCGANAAPCQPTGAPQCPPGGNPDPRVLMRELVNDGTLAPQCPLTCEELCKMHPPLDCACAQGCNCPPPPP